MNAIAVLIIALVSSLNLVQSNLFMVSDQKMCGGLDAYFSYILNDDLIEADSPSFFSLVTDGFGGTIYDSYLNDSIININDGFGDYPVFDDDGVFTMTFNFDLNHSPEGYDLTAIQLFTAHADNRAGINTQISVFTVDSPEEEVVLGYFYSDTPGYDNCGQAHYMLLQEEGSEPFGSGLTIPFATRVAAIRFYVMPSRNEDNWREIDVIGFPRSPPMTIVPTNLPTSMPLTRFLDVEHFEHCKIHESNDLIISLNFIQFSILNPVDFYVAFQSQNPLPFSDTEGLTVKLKLTSMETHQIYRARANVTMEANNLMLAMFPDFIDYGDLFTANDYVLRAAIRHGPTEIGCFRGFSVNFN